MKKRILELFLLFFTASLFGQRSGKHDISLGVLTQGEFYIFNGARQYYLFGEYRWSYKKFFARFRTAYFTMSYGGSIEDNLRFDSMATYLWLNTDQGDHFQFRDRVHLKPKPGLISLKNQSIVSTKIDFNVWLGYLLKPGKQKRFYIEPSVGLTAYYFRNDLFWLLFPLQFGDDVKNPALPRQQTAIFNTTRGIVWGAVSDVTLRYYLKKHYSLGMNVIGGSNKYFNTFYVGAFVGFNF